MFSPLHSQFVAIDDVPCLVWVIHCVVIVMGCTEGWEGDGDCWVLILHWAERESGARAGRPLNSSGWTEIL